MKVTYFFLSALLIFSSMFISCSEDEENGPNFNDKIVGEWKIDWMYKHYYLDGEARDQINVHYNGTASLIFNADKTMTFVDYDETVYSGNFNLEDDILTLTGEAANKLPTATYKVSFDETNKPVLEGQYEVMDSGDQFVVELRVVML